MEVYTEMLPERKASKRSAIQWSPATGNDTAPLAGHLLIRTARADVRYAVSEFPTDWNGRGFALVKVAGGTDPQSESYAVFCDKGGEGGDRCDCKGFTYARTCKHVDALRALVANGWV